MATLTELETTWSLDDVLRANALLDMREAIQRQAEQKRGSR